MNLNIKNYFLDEIKDDLYSLVKSSCYLPFECNSNKMGRIALKSTKNGKTKCFYPYIYIIMNALDLKSFLGVTLELSNTFFYCKSKKEKIEITFSSGIASRRLQVFEGLLFYNPPNSLHWFLCVDKDNKVYGTEEVIV